MTLFNCHTGAILSNKLNRNAAAYDRRGILVQVPDVDAGAVRRKVGQP